MICLRKAVGIGLCFCSVSPALCPAVWTTSESCQVGFACQKGVLWVTALVEGSSMEGAGRVAPQLCGLGSRFPAKLSTSFSHEPGSMYMAWAVAMAVEPPQKLPWTKQIPGTRKDNSFTASMPVLWVLERATVLWFILPTCSCLHSGWDTLQLVRELGVQHQDRGIWS